MNDNFSTPGNVSYDMIPYLNKVITEFPEKITGVVSTLAADLLFQICPPTKAHILKVRGSWGRRLLAVAGEVTLLSPPLFMVDYYC
jgi:hypothetical protein